MEGKREAKVQVSTECDAGRQAGEAVALLGGRKLLVAANQNPAELVMVRLGR